MMVHEERWGLWILYNCSNWILHPDMVGVAVLTNYFKRPLVQAQMETMFCRYCGGYFIYAGEESALVPYLEHDFQRLDAMGYYTMKDEELQVGL
ncbi:MAG: hypothetical protein QXG01_02920 [Candidatus Bathyarchaeia archaeon]